MVQLSRQHFSNHRNTTLLGYDYDEFGEHEQYGDADFYNEIMYTGGVYDNNSELYYFNSRYYNPLNSRFLSQDTYRGERTKPNTLHLYSYCANNPINYTDPTGHWFKSLHKEITEAAFSSLANTKKKKKMKKYLESLKGGSIAPDVNVTMKNSKFHGKTSGLGKVKDAYMKKAVSNYKNGYYSYGMWNLGVVLHTFQDYYAHNIMKGGVVTYHKKYVYNKKRKETHSNTFDDEKKYYSGGWKDISKVDNPRIKFAKSKTNILLKEFLNKV